MKFYEKIFWKRRRIILDWNCFAIWSLCWAPRSKVLFIFEGEREDDIAAFWLPLVVGFGVYDRVTAHDRLHCALKVRQKGVLREKVLHTLHELHVFVLIAVAFMQCNFELAGLKNWSLGCSRFFCSLRFGLPTILCLFTFCNIIRFRWLLRRLSSLGLWGPVKEACRFVAPNNVSLASLACSWLNQTVNAATT